MPDQQSPFVTNNNSQTSTPPPPLRPGPSATKPPLEAPHDLPTGSGSFSIPGATPKPAIAPATPKPTIPSLTPPPTAATPPSTPVVAPKPISPAPVTTPVMPTMPPKPAAPSAPSPAPAPAPLSPKPAQTPVNPAPTPTTSTAPAAPQNIASSIRTMQSDLDALKQGKAPTGIPLEKKPEAPAPSVSASAPTPSSSASGFTPPKPAAPSAPSPAPAPASAAKPITPTPLPTPPPSPATAALKPIPPAPSSTFSIPSAPTPSNIPAPQKPLTPSATPTPPSVSSVPFTPPIQSSGSHTKILTLILGIVILAIVGVSVWLYISNNSQVAVTSPSATPVISETPTPTPSQLALASALGNPDNLALPANADPQLAINAVVNNVSLTAGGIRTFRILDSDNLTPLSLKDFLSKMLITTPTQNASASAILNTKDWVLGVYGQVNSDTPTANTPITKKMFLVANVGTNTSGASQLLQSWETTLINDFASLLRYNKPAKPIKFIADSYNGTPFRYVQIPDKYSGIGYAIVNHYLFIESSRDTFRTILSRLLTIQ